MKQVPPRPHADLWTRAADMLAAFTLAWGTARAIALKWRMFAEHVVEALKALAPAEALARRLVFAHALTLNVKPHASRRIVRKVKHVSPFTIIALDPLAFRKSLEPPPPFFRIAPPHPLEKPAEQWRVRFCVARFAQLRRADGAQRNPPRSAQKDGGLRSAPSALREPGASRGNPIAIAANRRARRVAAKAAREAAYYAYWYGDPDAPRAPLNAAPTWRMPERASTDMLARRAEALRRVIDNPTRYARPLARRIAKHRPAVERIVRRWRRYGDAHCADALSLIDAALPAKVDTS